MSAKSSQPIGQLNGFWSLLFRSALVVFFAGVVPLNVFYVTKLYNVQERVAVLEAFAEVGDRFTPTDGALMESRIKEWHHIDVDDLASYISDNFERKNNE